MTVFLWEALCPGHNVVSDHLLIHINVAFDSNVGSLACDSGIEVSTRDAGNVSWVASEQAQEKQLKTT